MSSFIYELFYNIKFVFAFMHLRCITIKQAFCNFLFSSYNIIHPQSIPETHSETEVEETCSKYVLIFALK